MRTPDGELISDQINFVIIELSKLEDTIAKPINDMTSLEMWSIFLGYADNPKHRERINEMIEKKEVLGMAGALLTAISKDEHERAKFMSRRKAETDRMSDLLTAEANGVARGRAEGRADAIKEFVQNMKAMKISYGDIARATGLTIHDIESL
jgi:predicted transposase/invertase (TIGR01784 family)